MTEVPKPRSREDLGDLLFAKQSRHFIRLPAT